MEEENTENIDPKEKETILRDLQWWLYDLEEQNDIDMLYQLIDLKTEWEDENE